MVDHVTHHGMEQEKGRLHLELHELVRKQMKEKEKAPRTENKQKNISGIIGTCKSVSVASVHVL